MPRRRINLHCSVAGCKNPGFAKGWCRKHYGQMWRHGHLLIPRDYANETATVRDNNSLHRQLDIARDAYAKVSGLAGRIHWLQEIRSIEAEIERVKK